MDGQNENTLKINLENFDKIMKNENMVRRVFVRKLTSPFGEQFDNYSIENIEEFNEWSKQVEEKFSFPMLKRVFPIGIEISELRMEMFENRKFYFKADGYMPS